MNDLHAAIMNLPNGKSFADFEESITQRIAYKAGHRDARHAAAELVSAALAAQPEAKAEQGKTVEEVIDELGVREDVDAVLAENAKRRQSAPIEAGELPPLPKAERELIELHQPSEYTTHVCTSARYTADQMLAYGKLCRDIKLDDGDSIYRVHVEGWATKAGWVNKAEGAFEFAQRTCYRQGWNDAVTQLNMKEGQQ